jgi:CheY-like chemotaxis protein
MKKFSGAAIARRQVFTLADGSFVVQWEDKHVQELLTGHYRPYDHQKDFGHPVTDYELNQLVAAGRVEHYNRTWAWLYALPERGRFGHPRILDRGDRIRVYYLTSTLPKSELTNVQERLSQLELAEDFLARIRNNLVVILGKNGLPFRHLRDAERAQKILQTRASEMFGSLAVAFIETKADLSHQPSGETDSGSIDLDLNEIIASQADTTATEGRCMILAVRQEDERQEFDDLFTDKMKIDVHHAATGLEVVQMVEDWNPDLLVTDSRLPDMHVWQLLGKLKEIGSLTTLPVIVITDESAFGANVAQIESLIIRPVAIARLRHSVWQVLNAKKKDSQTTSS